MRSCLHLYEHLYPSLEYTRKTIIKNKKLRAWRIWLGSDEDIVSGQRDKDERCRLKASRFFPQSLNRLQSPARSFPGMDPSIPPFRGLDTQDGPHEYSSYDPPILYLKNGDNVPGTSDHIAVGRCEIDESLLLRLRKTAVLRHREEQIPYSCLKYGHTPNLALNSEFAGSRVGHTASPDFFFAFIITRIFYGGIHALALGHT